MQGRRMATLFIERLAHRIEIPRPINSARQSRNEWRSFRGKKMMRELSPFSQPVLVYAWQVYVGGTNEGLHLSCLLIARQSDTQRARSGISDLVIVVRSEDRYRIVSFFA